MTNKASKSSKKPADAKKKEKPTLATINDSATDLPQNTFPEDSLIAAALNVRHGLSVVEAEGRSFHGDNIVLVERILVDGIRYHRVKKTQYSYFRSKKAAIAAAQKQIRGKLQMFGGEKNDSE